MSAICFPEPEREPLPLRHSSPTVPDTGLSIEASPVYSNLSSPDDGHLNGDDPPRSGSAAVPTSGSESIASPKLNGKPLGLDEDEPDDQPPCLAPADEYNEGKTLLRPMESPPDDPPVINGLGSDTDHLLGSHTPASMVAAISLASNMTTPNGRNMVMGLTSITPSPSSPKIQTQGIVKVKQQRQQPATGKVHWSVERTSILLDLIETHIDRFGSSRTQRPLWKEIATKFCARFSISIDDVNGDHCYNKWKNLRRDLRDQRHSEKATRNPSIMSKVASLEALMMSRGGPHHGGGRNGLVGANSQVDPLVNSASLLDIKVAIKELKQECRLRDNLVSSPLIRNRNSYSSSSSAPPQPHAPPKKRPRRDLIADLPLVPNAASTPIQQQHQHQHQLQQQLQQQHEHLQQQQIQQLEQHHLSVGVRPSPPQDSSSPPETYNSLDNSCVQTVVKREDSPNTDAKHASFEHAQPPQSHVHHPAPTQPSTTSHGSPDQTFGLTPDLLMQIFHGVIPGAGSSTAPSQHSPQPAQQPAQHDPNFLSQHIVPTILNSLAVLSGGAGNGTSTPAVSQESLMAAAVALMSPSNSAPQPQPAESHWHRLLVSELGRWREMEESHERAREKMRLERRELKDRHEGLKRRMSEEKRNIQSRIFQVVVMGESLAAPGARQQP